MNLLFQLGDKLLHDLLSSSFFFLFFFDMSVLFRPRDLLLHDIIKDMSVLFQLGNNLATGLGAQAVGDAILKSEVCEINLLDLTVSTSSRCFLTGRMFVCRTYFGHFDEL